MARKALLIGSQTGGLSGVDNDLESMAAALDRWEFKSTSCSGADASRAGILSAYGRLIADAKDGDAIVVYYSGHGGHCLKRDEPLSAQPATAMQFIVPTDFDESADGQFRGIMAVELSLLLARLTEKTRNVTVALDCCHAAHMSRQNEYGLVVKAQPRAVPYDVVASHFDLLQRNRDFRVHLPNSNPWAVRIVACGQEQSAYEFHNADGLRTGMLTDTLTRALTEARGDGLRVSWSTVIDRVRQSVLTYKSTQRPEAEGPAQRLLFETEEADAVATLPVLVSGDRVLLSGASLLRVSVGDEFKVMPPDSCGPDDDTKIGDVVVDEIHATSAEGPLRLRLPELKVPLGARAYQTKAAAPAMPVRLPQESQRNIALARDVELSPILRPAESDEHCSVEVRADEAGALTIWDQNGPLHSPYVADLSGVAQVTQNLKRLAWANGLRCLAPDQAHTLDTPIDVEFGLVAGGETQPLSTSGAVLYLDQQIYVRVRNNGEERVFVSFVDIGVSSQITVLNAASPGGVPVDPGKEYTLGWNDYKKTLQGSKLSWPQELPRSQPRPETIVVLVTSRLQNIRGLEQQGLRGNEYNPLVEEGPRSSLEQLIDQIDHGATRDLTASEGPPVRYTVRTVDFELVPVVPPVSEDPEFQVDERPEPSMLLWSPKGAAPATVAVCLSDLVVHRNRALRSADIRLDAIAITRGSGKRPIVETWTERFSNISDGDSLPLGKAVIYHGPAADYLDLAVWVTRDASESLDLADLMKDKLTDSDFQMAVGQIGGLLVAAPQAAAAVAAIGAGAVVINAAYRLLTGIVGKSIGLYRTTLLAGERFGVGRPADQCVVRAQDFSFTYRIEDVS